MFFNNNINLTEHLKQSGVLKTKEIISAFLKIDRKNFIPSVFLNEAYNDYPLPIGEGQTISQPYTVAFMLELLEPKKGQKILDIGFGSGWTTCLLAEIVGKKGKVYAIEIIPEVFEFGKKNIEKYDFLKEGRVEIFCADGSKGLKEKSPFDRILVSAAAKEIPQELINQLENNGVLVIPDFEGIYKIKKIDGKIEKEYYYGFVFVPLTHK
ncbi:MAG: protein-L-isoaspartate(D-aspartate) O-methyltransferase [Candidatus Aenigmatarchaeota archaeon]